MSIPLGFPGRQLRIWALRREGLSRADIGRRLGITRQAVCNVMGSIEDQVSQTLRAVAAAAKIEERHLDASNGMLLGYSHGTRNRVIVTFSATQGAQIWQHHTGNCHD